MSRKILLTIALVISAAAVGWWRYPRDGVELWNYHVGGELIAPPVIGDDGTVYAAGSSIVALRPDGLLRWRKPSKGAVRGGLSLSNDGRSLYVESWAHGSSLLQALDSQSGDELWSYTIGAGALEGSIAIGEDDRVYVAGTGIRMLSSNGKELWSAPFYSNVRPVIGPTGAIYLATAGGRVTAVNPDGTERWIFESEAGFSSSPTIGSDGTLYAMNQRGHLFALHDNGQKLWDVKLGPGDLAAPVIGEDGTLYVAGQTGVSEGKLLALRPGDGSLMWQKDFRGPAAPPTISADGTVYVGTYSQALHAYDKLGKGRWSFHALAMFGVPTLDRDGTLLVGTNTGYLYALRASGGALAHSPWAKYGMDMKNSGRAMSMRVPHQGQDQHN